MVTEVILLPDVTDNNAAESFVMWTQVITHNQPKITGTLD